jgi:DNA-binding response OmpR family regulator
MRILLTAKDKAFSDRAQAVFGREDAVLRVADRNELWERDTGTAGNEVILLQASSAASALRWCRVARRVRRTLPLIVCCDGCDSVTVSTLLDEGADDVITSGITDGELLARVRAVCRRARILELRVRDHGPIVIDAEHRAAAVDGVPIPLRRAEYRLLSHLVANADRVVEVRELIEDVLGGVHTGDTAAVRVHLSQLRRKLGVAGAAIETVRGQGYRLAATVAGEPRRREPPRRDVTAGQPSNRNQTAGDLKIA